MMKPKTVSSVHQPKKPKVLCVGTYRPASANQSSGPEGRDPRPVRVGYARLVFGAIESPYLQGSVPKELKVQVPKAVNQTTTRRTLPL